MLFSLPTSLVLAAVFWTSSVPAVATASAERVIDLNFEDLDAAVQAHPFLAVAFYSPGCGHCRRLLPSWSQAAQLLEDQSLPIRLGRIDVSSRGGMLAWKAFGLKRVPAVKVFVDNNSDEPLSYAGHLDASGIAAHLAMLERDRRRHLEHQDKYGNPAKTNRQGNSSNGGDRMDAPGVSWTELLESGVIIVSLSAPPTAAAGDSSPRPSLVENLRCAVGRERLSLFFFVPEDTPKTRRMTAELLKAAPLLAKAHPPTSIILVDLRPPDGSIRDDYHGTGGGRRSTSRSDHLLSNPDAALVKRQLSAEFQVPLENGPELRVFFDGKAWLEAGVFRGLPTRDGIVQHMEWVAVEAGLRPQNKRRMEGVQRNGATASDGETATATVTILGDSLSAPIETLCRRIGYDESWPTLPVSAEIKC